MIAWTRKVSNPEWAAITDRPSTCMASKWYDYILDVFKTNLLKLNLTVIETDGPYHGYTCASKEHKYHKDITDSVFQQSKMQAQFYLELHKLGFYVNQPDDYFFYGANKNGIHLEFTFSIIKFQQRFILKPWDTMKDNFLCQDGLIYP